jgi:cobalt-zinc-cadmium efflux system protein
MRLIVPDGGQRACGAFYDRPVSRARRLTVVLLLNLALVAALVITGVATHSLAVFAAGADYLADAAAIGVSLLAIWLAGRAATRTRPPSPRWSTPAGC